LSDAGWGPLGPCDDVISRVAAGSAVLPCCLLFLPNRNDMAPASQPWGRYNGSGCRLHTHSVYTEAGKLVGWAWVEWSSCGRAGQWTSSEARGCARAVSRCYGRSAGVVRMSKERKCRCSAGAVQAQCKTPKVGDQAGCGVSSATFGRR
jgi:hypothetical protein